jgi:predicted aconitase
MHLTRQEEKIYDGEFGWAYETSMKILVRLGDLFDATRLIPIKSAHISGVSYKTLGDAPIDFLKALVENKAKVRVPSTLNPSSFDPYYMTNRITPEQMEKQTQILALYKQMGVTPALTCTPYYLQPFRADWHLAWAESSAVMYANSVLKAWTNREGSPSALAAALIGKTPNYGMHQPGNRQASIRIKMETALKTETDYGVLGVHVGKIVKDKIPVFEGLPKNASGEDLKFLGAGLASSGMTSMFHYKPAKLPRLETVSIGKKEMEAALEGLSVVSEKPNLVCMGCPHCSFNEVKTIAKSLHGRRVQKELWVCTSRFVREKAAESVKVIEKAGGHVLCDTCAVVTWLREPIMTNSAKCAYYMPTMNKANAVLAPLNECIKAATS